jgi:HprK-related kinase B
MSVETDHLSSWIRAYLDRYPPVEDLHLLVAGCAVRTASNSGDLIEYLRGYYRDYVVAGGVPDIDLAALQAPIQDTGLSFNAHPPGPGKWRIKDEFVDFDDGRMLRKRMTGMLFLFGPAGNLTVGPCLEQRNQVVNFVNNRFIQCQVDRGGLLCHAAGVAGGGCGIALAGMSGRGKSTLALHLLNQGLDFVSNDRLMIRRAGDDVQMIGVPKLPRINPGTIINNPALEPMLSPEERRRFQGLTREVLWGLERKYDVDVNRYFGAGRVRLSARLAGVVILSWSHGGGPTRAADVDLAERRDLLTALIKPVGAAYHAIQGAPFPDASEEAYLENLAGLPAVEVGGGIDFTSASAACEDLLARGATL